MSSPARPGSRLATLAAALGAVGSCAAQSTTQATVTLAPTWEEVGGNNNGLLEPGESARVLIGMSFSPAVNTVIPFVPAGGGQATGTLRGFGNAFFDLLFQNASGGTYYITGQTGGVSNGLAGPWRPGPSGNGAVVGDSIINIQPGQFPFNSLDYDPIGNPTGVRTDNPVPRIYTAVWMPGSYTPRTVSVRIAPAIPATTYAAVLLQTEADPSHMPVAIACGFDFRAVNIPIVPAPAAPLALGAALALAAHRTRHGKAHSRER